MSAALIQCPGCKATLLDNVFNRSDLTPCPSCSEMLQIEVFPALFRRYTPGSVGEAVMTEGESSCFYHPQKKAVLHCDSCGRFLCALCDCPFEGRHLCPACLETGKTKGKIKNLADTRTLYDGIALALTLLPVVIMWPLTIVTAPMALFIAIRYWNAPTSLVRRTKARFVVAIVFASLQILGWVAIIYFWATSSHG